MNLENSWNEALYQEFLAFLNTKQDLKYKEFHSKIITSNN